jgi:agmatine/peptidylarginine deiminase
VRSGGQITILDPEYYLKDRPEDDALPSQLAELLHVSLTKVPLRVEGGNVLSNGQGLCLTSTSFPLKNAKLGYSSQQAMELLRKFYGFEHIAMIPHLSRESTGHVDMYAMFISPQVVLVGAYDSQVDAENAAQVDEAARFLATVPTKSGRLRVVRVPMPSNSDGIWRSYTNVLFANDLLLVPTYSDIAYQAQEKVLEMYQRLMPGVEVIGINADSLARAGGALHCVSLNIPWLEGRFPPPGRWDRHRYQADRGMLALR